LLTGGFGRFVMSDVFESAFAPAFAPAFTPTNEAGCALELEWVVAAPQAAVSSAAPTRSIRNLVIALRITHRTPVADGLDAA
jgi:hypothetical protein